MFDDIDFGSLFGGDAFIPDDVSGMNLDGLFGDLDLSQLGILVDDEGNLMPDPNGPYTPTGPSLRGTPDFRNVFGGGNGGGNGGNGSSPLSGLQRLLGMGGNNGLAGLLPILATVFGGVNQRNATQEAQERMERAVSEANDTVKGILGTAGDQFKPYQEAGAGAVKQLSGMGPSDLASKFGALSGGGSLAGQFGPIGAASNLAPKALQAPQSIAGQFRPLGAGRALSSLRRG